MYCVKCGVKLSPELNRCPLCGTRVIDPDLAVNFEATRSNCEKKYSEKAAKAGINIAKATYLRTAQFIIFTIALFVVVINLSVTSNLSWSKFALLGLAEIYSLMVVSVRQYGKLTAGKIIFVQVVVFCALFALLNLLVSTNFKVSIVVASTLLFAFSIGASPFYSGKKIFVVNHIATCFAYLVAYLVILDLLTAANGFSLIASTLLITLFSYIMLPLLLAGKRKLEIIFLLDLIVTVACEFLMFYLLHEREIFLILALPNSLYILFALYFIFKTDQKKKLMIYGTLSMIFGLLIGWVIIFSLTLLRVADGVAAVHISMIIGSVFLLVLTIFFAKMERDIKFREWVEKKLTI